MSDEDMIVASAMVAVITGLSRKVFRTDERWTVGILALAMTIVGLLAWSAQHWHDAALAFGAAKAVIGAVAGAIGLYESSKVSTTRPRARD